jgi:hypothetical protein
MISIATAVAQVCAQPAPVIFIDTCSLLDLFRMGLMLSFYRLCAGFAGK